MGFPKEGPTLRLEVLQTAGVAVHSVRVGLEKLVVAYGHRTPQVLSQLPATRAKYYQSTITIVFL